MQTHHRLSKSRVQRGFGAWILALTVGLLASLAPAAAQEVLRIPLAADIGSFDPDNGFEVAAMSAIDNVYEGLVQYQPGSTKIVGALARSWEISDDGLVYSFHLATGVRFHDGTPCNAAAVVKSFERRRDHKLVLSYFLANVAKLAASDEATVVLTLKQPQPSFLDSLASPWGPKVISPAALDQHDAGDSATGWLTEHAVGTGPYKLTEFQRGERYVLSRNEDYWGKQPFFSEIRIPLVPDISQQILQLQAGEIDAVPVNYPIAQLGRLPEGLEITSAPNMSQFDLFTKPGTVLDDPEVRNAVLTAINPALWVRDAFGKYATPAKSVYPQSMLDAVDPIAYPTDFEAAKAAIKKHGAVALTIGLHSAQPSYQRASDLMIAQLALIGVQATAHVLPSGAAYALKGDPKAPDLLLTIASPDAGHPENQAKVFFTKDAALNFYGRVLAEADAIIDQAGLKTNIAERNALYEKAGRMYVDAGYVIPLADVDDIVVHAAGLKDLGLRAVFPRGNIDFASAHR
jgi:peptide/nickel transport system substrate-binding protein